MKIPVGRLLKLQNFWLLNGVTYQLIKNRFVISCTIHLAVLCNIKGTVNLAAIFRCS